MKLKHFLTFLLIFFNSALVLSIKNEDIPTVISKEVKTLKNSKKPSQKLLKTIKNWKKIEDKNVSDEVFCQSCHLVVGQILDYRKEGASKDSMKNFFQKLCNTFTDWGSTACDGYIDIELDTVLYIIDNKKDLTPERVCSISFQKSGCQDPQAHKWNIHITPPQQTLHPPNNQKTVISPLKLLHLTDFHYDPLYQPGNNAQCDVPLCCQTTNGPPAKPEDAAGYWGDYHVCDMPWHTVTDFMTYVTTYHKNFDYVYYTGDIISHKSWATTKDLNVKAIQDLFKLFKDSFKDTPVYPILGNHEPHPTDFYSPGNLTNSKLSTQWIFDLVATEWAKWLPNSTQDTLRKGGYYTVLVRPGFRIVALNSNVCYTSNLWLIYDDDDPYGQLKWLVEILTQAEKNGEKVHILSHIPPGEIECLQQWTYQFRKIVNRFASIISAQFNGHTHFDELRLFYDSNNTDKVINMAFNAGSFTTYIGLNPNYRLYDVDQSNYTVLDYDHYTFNLTKANQNVNISPQWYKLYSFKEAYGLQDTTPNSLNDLVKRMSQNHTLIEQYFRYKVRESDVEMSKGCNEECLIELLCSITSTEAFSSLQCQKMKKASQ